MATERSDKDTWGLRSGDPITEELTAIKLLGGGAAYEAFLAFDDVTYAPVVVKVVRPAQVADEATLRGLRREVEMLDRVNHPAVVRALRAQLDAIGSKAWLEVDGGVKADNIERIARAGADTFVAGSAIFGAKDYRATIEAMRSEIAKSANVAER